MSTWLEGTYMARKGVAKGKPGKTHQLTVEKQGKYHYVYGPYADPVLHDRSRATWSWPRPRTRSRARSRARATSRPSC